MNKLVQDLRRHHQCDFGIMELGVEKPADDFMIRHSRNVRIDQHIGIKAAPHGREPLASAKISV